MQMFSDYKDFETTSKNDKKLKKLQRISDAFDNCVFATSYDVRNACVCIKGKEKFLDEVKTILKLKD